MAYTKLNLAAGSKVEASQINHIDSGVAENDAALARKLGWTQLWSSSSSTFGEGNITANLTNYKLAAIITSHGTFFYSTLSGQSSMYYIYPNTSSKTLTIYTRYFYKNGTNIWISGCYREYIHSGSSYSTGKSIYLVPQYVFGII